MIAKYLTILCFLLTSSLAAMDLSHPLKLAELVEIALENHPETRQAWWNARRASSAIGRAQSAYYPKVDLEANIRHGRDFKFINGPDVTYTIIDADLVLSMILYDFGERKADVESAKMALIAADWQHDWTIQKVLVRVLENAYSTLHAQEILQGALISLKDAEKMLDVSKRLNQAGLSPVSDVYTTQATLSQMQMEVAQQRALLDIQKGKLATSLGLSADTPLELAALEDLPLMQKQHTKELMTLAKQQRADMMAKQAQVLEALAREKKTRASYSPKLSLYGRGGGEHALDDKAKAGHYQIALNLDVPLFTGFDAAYQNRMAYADSQISMESLAQLELDIVLEVLTHSRSLEAAQEMLCYAEDNMKNAQKAYEGTLEKYQAGKERIAETSNTLRQLAAARTRYSDIRTRWLVSMANLAYSTGTLLPYMENACAKYP